MMIMDASSTLAHGINCASTNATFDLRRGSNSPCQTWQLAEADGGPAIVTVRVDSLCSRYIEFRLHKHPQRGGNR